VRGYGRRREPVDFGIQLAGRNWHAVHPRHYRAGFGRNSGEERQNR
jgi:hypothetical protein